MSNENRLKREDYEKTDDGYLLKKNQLIQTVMWGHHVTHEYFGLTPHGILFIKAGYFWDGASGAIDTPDFMRGSLVHDVLYQMLRELHFFGSSNKWTRNRHRELREIADRCLIYICDEDGMWKIRQWWVSRALKLAGGIWAYPDVEYIIGVYQALQDTARK